MSEVIASRRDFSAPLFAVRSDPARSTEAIDRLDGARAYWIERRNEAVAVGEESDLEDFFAKKLATAMLVERLRVRREAVRRAAVAARGEWDLADPSVVAFAEELGAGNIIRGLEAAVATLDAAWDDVDEFVQGAIDFATPVGPTGGER